LKYLAKTKPTNLLKYFGIFLFPFLTIIAPIDASAENIYIFGDRPNEITSLNNVLTAQGHSVTTSANLPADLSAFDNIWHVEASPMNPTDLARVIGFLQSGRGVHLTGERLCCDALNDDVEIIANTVVAAGGISVGRLGDRGVPTPFNPNALNGITTTPNTIIDWHPSISGAMDGVTGDNILATALSDGATVGAVWGPNDMVANVGCLTILMDVNWFTSDVDKANIVENIQNFHNTQCAKSVCGDGIVEGLETCDDGNNVAADGCSDTCIIEPGFVCPTPGMLCDPDECAMGTDNCDTNALCVNTIGSFTCTCNAGYTGDGVTCDDIDECATGVDNCDANAICTNLPGTFSCDCAAGYDGDGITCNDIDECGLGIDNCDANAVCTNTPGAFVCACNDGYMGDGTSCVDIDECATDTDTCDANAACTNNIGSFSCDCNTGFIGDGMTCTDIDECSDGTDNCAMNATCTNTPGAFTCACDAGYMGDGTSCTDIDECATGTDTCDANATCTNEIGTFTCVCSTGFTGDGMTCTDVDECTDGTDNCAMNATCANTPGAFTCACDGGYMGDGTSCTDIDECTDGSDNCDTNAACENTPGAFTCTCNAGYQGDGLSCVDIDECLAMACSEDAVCENVDGSVACTCKEGFEGDGSECSDIDECEDESDNCAEDATCTNTPGGFTCECPEGVDGDGTTCTIGDQDGDGIPDNVECSDLEKLDECKDTDMDGTPDYLDTDSDNDNVLDSEECPDPEACRDTDGDATVDYLDIDDDGDAINTKDEDANLNNDPTDDDSDSDGLADYLDPDPVSGNILAGGQSAGCSSTNNSPGSLLFLALGLIVGLGRGRKRK